MMKDVKEEKKSRLWWKTPDKKRIGLTLLFMAVFSIIFQIGSYSTVSEEEANEFMDLMEIQLEGVDEVAIWLNNLRIATMMFVPFGFIIGGFISFQTGWAFAAASVLNPELTQIPAIALLYITPFGLMELFCYGIAMSRSVIIVHALIKKRFRKQLYPTLKEWLIVSLVLLVSGVIEWRMIQWATEQGVSII